MFARKFLGTDLSEEQRRRKQLFDDFDPCYGLEGGDSHAVLDWERRAMEMVARQQPGRVKLRYIDEMGATLGGEKRNTANAANTAAAAAVPPHLNSPLSPFEGKVIPEVASYKGESFVTAEG